MARTGNRTQSAATGETAKDRRSVSAERREEIIGAAIRVFKRDGFRGANLDDIAAEVGVSKSLVYYYYASKLELLFEIYARMGNLLYARIMPVLTDSTIPHEERLRQAIEEHVSAIVSNQAIFEIFFRERNELPEDLRQQESGGEKRYIHALQQLIEDGIEAGVFEPLSPVTASFAIVGACNWLTYWYRPAARATRKRKALKPAEIADDIYRLVTRGLLKGCIAEPGGLRAASEG